MKSDIAIAQACTLRPIGQIAEAIGLQKEIIQYGPYMAKIPLSAAAGSKQVTGGKLILVTAMTPTPFGEGKTTNTIGIVQALSKIGKQAIAAIREPSLGPCMGVKGGAAGGGYSQVLPMEEINLHFTGDIHAVSIAHNLLSAMIDNHIHQHAEPHLNPAKVSWPRVMDMNDRSLRNIAIGLSDHGENGQARRDGFEITAASEVMAILCLAHDLEDLKHRLGNIIVGTAFDGTTVYASDLHAQGAMAALLKQAINPNLVQSIEGVPVLIHGGPFANIAHGCNSITATRTAMRLADYTVTEAGFASELGAEKFFNITCRVGEFAPRAAVLVVTLRAYKIHGMDNILKHVENIRLHGIPAIISINRFLDDDEQELIALKAEIEGHEIPVSITDFREAGGNGGIELAHLLVDACEAKQPFCHLYELEMPLKEKIQTICTKIYGADGVSFAKGLITRMRRLEQEGYGTLPVCMAKTQMSLTDNPKTTGRPKGFTISVTRIEVKAGAGFIVVYTGEVMTMPGLPKVPSACSIDITAEGTISGLF
ncbi:MAG: formate--tetrahydrofolate ligase [Spirochaetia bacterium]|nr:formate--tetrahydrofolate ligase [Spirochaetia bacterium]